MLDRQIQNHIGRHLKTMYDVLYVRDAAAEHAMAERLRRLAVKLRTRDAKAG
jgi:hypothetical protein